MEQKFHKNHNNCKDFEFTLFNLNFSLIKYFSFVEQKDLQIDGKFYMCKVKNLKKCFLE